MPGTLVNSNTAGVEVRAALELFVSSAKGGGGRVVVIDLGGTMVDRLGRSARVFVLLLTQALFGCAIVDSYSGRAVDYNREAESAQGEVLLLNIVRASMRRPMQFTGLQSITGSANVSGAVTGGAVGTKQTPYISQFPKILPPTNSNTALSSIIAGNVSGNASLSGSATFTVPVLDTQEFYQGILQPIPLQAFDYYLQQGFPPELLFDLFILKVEVTRRDDGSCRKFTFVNSVRDDLQWGQFQAFMDYLIGSGLSAEKVNTFTPIGPPIAGPGMGSANAQETAQVVEAYSRAANAGLEIRQEGRGTDARFRVHKKTNNYRFCFGNPGGVPSDWVARQNSAMFCGQFNRGGQATALSSSEPRECVRGPRGARPAAEAGDDLATRGVHESGVSELSGIRLSPEFLNRIDRLQRAAQEARPDLPEDAYFQVRDFANGLVSFKVYTRSTEGILYYLGEITRRRLFTEFGDVPRTIQVKTGLRHGTLPMGECDDRENGASWQARADLVSLSRRRPGSARGGYYCENMFVLSNELGGDNIITVRYDGMFFGVPRDPNKSGRTLQVLELTKQLLALNTSAKQLPATGVISVISP